MTTKELRMSLVKRFAKRLAVEDRAACALAETEMDGEWAGEHTTALADHLGCRVRDLTVDDIAWAEEAYAQETCRPETKTHNAWSSNDIVATCPLCGKFAIVELTKVLKAKQPDDTTHVCHPGFGGCNHGFAIDNVATFHPGHKK